MEHLLEIQHEHDVVAIAHKFRDSLPESVKIIWSKASNDTLYALVSNIDQRDLTALILQLDIRVKVL